jgi:hypothetical protein
MEIDPIDAISKSVVRLEFGQVAVRQPRQFLHILVTGDGPNRCTTVRSPRGLTIDRCAKDRVTGKRVETAGWFRLVDNFVRAVAIR